MLTQEHYKRSISLLSLVACAFLMVSPAVADNSNGPDPILSGPQPGPCASAMAGPDYVAGVDATGNPVVPADGSSSATPPPGTAHVRVPVRGSHGEEVDANVDLAALAPPTCEPPQHHR
jgi:hypothetical protein